MAAKNAHLRLVLKSQKPKQIAVGTLRIRVKDLQVVEKTSDSWKISHFDMPGAMHAIALFKAHENLSLITDVKDPRFFKGQLSPDGKCQGARIAFLPDGQKLFGAFSLFAKNLRFHDEDTDQHWDVLYENPSGFCYLYTLDKIHSAKERKTHIVDEFSRVYPRLKSAVLRSLHNGNGIYSLALYTMMKTYMRVGNDIYYKAHGHKGLTTLQKKDITIKGNIVFFDYIAKSGVPITISENFPSIYITNLQKLLQKKKSNSFVFADENNQPLHGKDFKQAIKKYCGKEFYPHIIRSYYADTQVKDFFKAHRTATKGQVHELLVKIASKLGHRKYNKKDHEWVESPKVTVSNYIRPEYAERLQSLYS